MPPGYSVAWSGQFEYMERAIEKMKVVVPITLLIIFLLTIPVVSATVNVNLPVESAQWRDTSGDYGISHAEANCRSGRLEPTALQEDRFHRDGQKIEMRLTPISADDEAAIVGLACKGVAR